MSSYFHGRKASKRSFKAVTNSNNKGNKNNNNKGFGGA